MNWEKNTHVAKIVLHVGANDMRDGHTSEETADIILDTMDHCSSIHAAEICYSENLPVKEKQARMNTQRS